MHVNVVRESNRDDRQSWNGLGAHGREPRGTVHPVLDLFGDQLFDLLGRQPRRLRLDVHLGGYELRKDVERRAQGTPTAHDQRQDRQYTDGTEVTDTERDE